MEINDYIVKLTGKASILEKLELGKNYKIEIDASIVSTTDEDNEDGTLSRYYKVEPVLMKIVKDNGLVIKSKDIRSRSKQLRSAIWREWQAGNVNEDFDSYYDRVMVNIIKQIIS